MMTCPSCGSTKTTKCAPQKSNTLDTLVYTLVYSRLCIDCGTIWQPACPRWLGILFIIFAFGVWCPFLIITIDAWRNPGQGVLSPAMSAILLGVITIGLLKLFGYGYNVLRGKSGAQRIIHERTFSSDGKILAEDDQSLLPNNESAEHVVEANSNLQTLPTPAPAYPLHPLNAQANTNDLNTKPQSRFSMWLGSKRVTIILLAVYCLLSALDIILSSGMIASETTARKSTSDSILCIIWTAVVFVSCALGIIAVLLGTIKFQAFARSCIGFAIFAVLYFSFKSINSSEFDAMVFIFVLLHYTPLAVWYFFTKPQQPLPKGPSDG